LGDICALPLLAHSGAAAVAVHNHVDAAAAIHSLLEWYEKDENLVKVDLEAGCVSLAWRAWRAVWNGRAVHDSAGCIILSLGGASLVRCARANSLPPTFIGVQQAQQVQRRWHMLRMTRVT
jgi:hypothetical protein